jgi:DNA-binding NarL/FixJ family response regulator
MNSATPRLPITPKVESVAATRVKVMISDSSRISCELMGNALQRLRSIEVVSSAVNAKEIAEAVGSYQPDIVLVNAHLEEGPFSGFKVLRRLRELAPSIRIILMTDSADRELVLEAFRGGARGIFHRSESLQVLAKCIHAVHRGQVWANSLELQVLLEAFEATLSLRVVNSKGERLLTNREHQLITLVAEGLTNREISLKLNLSEHTVKNHLFRIYDKLGISSRVELILYAVTQRNIVA